MARATSSVEGVLADLLTPILPKIDRELTREGLIDIHQLISGNAASMASNLGEVQNGHLALTMTTDEYMEQKGFAFLPPHNQRLELNSSDKTTRCFENTPLWTEP